VVRLSHFTHQFESPSQMSAQTDFAIQL